MIFNTIVGNADAHGKNFSILYDEGGPRLAPLYDLLATIAYPDLSPNFAMKIGKRATLQELDAKGWAAFAAYTGLGLPLIRRRVTDSCERLAAQIPFVTGRLSNSGFDDSALLDLGTMIDARTSLCARSVI